MLHTPHESEKVSIELTVKEAMALGAGVKFPADRTLAASARKKVLRSLEGKLLPDTSKSIDYHLLEA